MTGTKGSDQIINILISRIGERVYIQERRVDPAADAPVTTRKSQPSPTENCNKHSDQFTQTGAVTLEGLDFTSGSTNLGEGPFSSCLNWRTICAKIQIQKLYWSVTAMRWWVRGEYRHFKTTRRSGTSAFNFKIRHSKIAHHSPRNCISIPTGQQSNTRGRNKTDASKRWFCINHQ